LPGFPLPSPFAPLKALQGCPGSPGPPKKKKKKKTRSAARSSGHCQPALHCEASSRGAVARAPR
jgi:hypothetical protein